MIKNIVRFILIIFFLSINQSFSSESDKAGNDGVGSITPKTSIAKKPVKISKYKSVEKKMVKAKKLEEKGKFKKAEKLYNEALEALYKANKELPFHPEILNYLGFANNKINKLEDAEIYYVMGLEISPNHLSMNEHLGKLYVETNRIKLAKERLDVLKNCNCQEYEELKAIIASEKVSKY